MSFTRQTHTHTYAQQSYFHHFRGHPGDAPYFLTPNFNIILNQVFMLKYDDLDYGDLPFVPQSKVSPYKTGLNL